MYFSHILKMQNTLAEIQLYRIMSQLNTKSSAWYMNGLKNYVPLEERKLKPVESGKIASLALLAK